MNRLQQHQRHEAATEALAGKRSPPHDANAERGVLSAICWSPPARLQAFDQLVESHFYLPQHQRIWRALGELHAEDREIDALIVKDRLRTLGTLSEAGDEAYVDEVLTTETSGLHIGEYIEILQQQSVARQLHYMSLEILANVHAGGTTPMDIVDEVSSGLDKIIQGREPINDGSYADVFSVDTARPIPSGLIDLDMALGGGFYPGELIIIAARPSVGKTGLARQASLNIAKNKTAAVFFSMEETVMSLREKSLAHFSNLPHEYYRRRQIFTPQGEFIFNIANPPPAAVAARAELEALPHKFLMRPDLFPARVKSEVKQLRTRGKCDIIFIDYLQKMIDPEHAKKKLRRDQELGEITGALKRIALALNIPVVIGCQLNRGVEGRDKPEPFLKDLRESGEIEQDADTVIMLYNDSSLRAKIAKQRNGPVTNGEANLRLTFEKVYQRIVDHKKDYAYKAINVDVAGAEQ